MEATDNSMKDKKCLVCSDKALGYNFNAVTCESCKAFFRRNALKNKEFKCPFNNKCEITTVTRRFCQFCRLVKCFDVGMKKEYIMSEQEKSLKRKKIQEKKSLMSEIDLQVEIPTKRPKFDSLDDNQSKEKGYLLKIQRSPNIIHHTSEATIKGRDLLDPGDHHGLTISPSSSKISYDSGSDDSRAQTCSRISRNNDKLSGRYSADLDDHSPNYLTSPQKACIDLRRCSQSPFDQVPLPSPNMGEPSSPVGSVLAGVRRNRHLETSQSRPVEIYKISKACDIPKSGGPSIIKNMLCSDYKASDHDLEGRVTSPTSTPLLSLLGEGRPGTSHEHSSFRSDVAADVLRSIPNRSRLDLGNSIDSILTEAIKLEYEAYSSINPRISSRELNDAERAKLNELIVANKALLAPLEDDLATEVAQAVTKDNLGVKPMLVDVLNLTAVAIRRLIKMSKKVNAFKNMCQEDQVALLKGGCIEMMILRSAMTYDSDRGSWKIPQSAERLMNIKVDVLKEAGGRVFEEHQRFLQTFDPKWRNDENIMLILSAITLFTPDRPRVVHYDVIKLEQNSYYYLLRRYLESIYPGCEARSTFLKLIHKIAELHRLNEDHVRVYMELNPEDVEPLLIEIFDLNLH